jgi:hypothetical protein
VLAPVEVLLRHRLVVAHELAAVDHLEDARRHVEERVAVRVPALEQSTRAPLATSRAAATQPDEPPPTTM